MPLFQEVKRRNVLRVAGLYLVGAWLVLQVASTLLPIFNTPGWVLRALVVVLAIGFLPALVFGWVFEFTPQGLKREDELPAGTTPDPAISRRMDRAIIVVLLLALAAFAIERFVFPVARDAPAAPVATAPAKPDPAPAVNPKSIAVLPFDNLSDDKANEYFVSGMQDVILTKLSDVGELHVASRTSTERYAGAQRPGLREIAEALRVAYVLEGSVQKAGNQVLINVQLIDARSDAHLWAQSYKRTLDDIFGVEGEVAQLVAEALHAKLTAAESAALASVATSNKEALDAYLRGRWYLRQSNRSLDPADLDRAIALSRQATTLDPRYADAWSLLALAHFKRGGPHYAEFAEDAARKALAIDPDHYGGHVQLGFALSVRGEHEGAIAQGREAVRLRPDELSAQTGLGVVLAYAGRMDEALAVFADSAARHPTEGFPRNWRTAILLSRREYAAAREAAQDSVARDPADLWSLSLLVTAHLNGAGDLDAARASLRRAPMAPSASPSLADQWFAVEFQARDFAAARSYLGQPKDAQRLLDLAEAALAQHDASAVRAALAQARAQLQPVVDADAQDPYALRQLATCLSLLGEHAAARRAAQKALALQAPALNAIDGPSNVLTLAQVDMRAGRIDAAVDGLRQLMQLPAGRILSARLLRVDPAWDPLRATPQFQDLLKQYPLPP